MPSVLKVQSFISTGKSSRRYPPFKTSRCRPTRGVQSVQKQVDDQLSSELAPPLVALPFDLPDERKEKRFIRRREKLPDFLRLIVAAAAKLLPMLEMSSWDWLRLDSFSRCLLRNNSFVPLWRKPTKGSRQICECI